MPKYFSDISYPTKTLKKSSIKCKLTALNHRNHMGFKHEMRTLPHPNTFPPCNKSVVIDGATLKNYAKKSEYQTIIIAIIIWTFKKKFLILHSDMVW